MLSTLMANVQQSAASVPSGSGGQAVAVDVGAMNMLFNALIGLSQQQGAAPSVNSGLPSVPVTPAPTDGEAELMPVTTCEDDPYGPVSVSDSEMYIPPKKPIRGKQTPQPAYRAAKQQKTDSRATPFKPSLVFQEMRMRDGGK